MSVQMELSRIIISEVNDQQVVYLKEVEGDRTFPILIGLFEATSIDRRVKHHQSPRPLTHDLLVAAVELMGGEFQDVVEILTDCDQDALILRVKQRGGGCCHTKRSTCFYRKVVRPGQPGTVALERV